MTDTPTACVRIAEDLLAAAIGEASPTTVQHVERHVARCGSCRREFDGFRALDGTVATLRREPLPSGQVAQARERLETRIEDLRRRLLAYRIFPSALGHILIARSELGIALVEYLDRGTSLRSSRLGREPGVEAVEGGPELEAAYRDLLEYLTGRRRRFEWPLDLRLARSDFQRSVLHATSAIPYGAVVSYAGLAHDVGKASAPRAVAQALRWNPLPIVIPCHRVIGTSGALTGYAGSKLGLKQRLLSVEGIPTTVGADCAEHPIRGDVRPLPRGSGILRPDLFLPRHTTARPPHTLRVARARRGRGVHSLHRLPARPSSNFTLAALRCHTG